MIYFYAFPDIRLQMHFIHIYALQIRSDYTALTFEGYADRGGDKWISNRVKRVERKYYCKNPAPALIDCLFYRLKHFSEFDSETAACSYIYSSCRTQQFPPCTPAPLCRSSSRCAFFFYGNILLFPRTLADPVPPLHPQHSINFFGSHSHI